MKPAAKTTLNSMEEVLHEINTLVAQQENEDYAKIFIKRSNLNSTYQSNDYLEIIEITTTLYSKNSMWNADFNF